MREGGPLGLSIVGGSDHCSHPFGMDEPGIFISKVKPGVLKVSDSPYECAVLCAIVSSAAWCAVMLQFLVLYQTRPPLSESLNGTA